MSIFKCLFNVCHLSRFRPLRIVLDGGDDVLGGDPGLDGSLPGAHALDPEADLARRRVRVGRVLDHVETLRLPVRQRVHDTRAQLVLRPLLVLFVTLNLLSERKPVSGFQILPQFPAHSTHFFAPENCKC